VSDVIFPYVKFIPLEAVADPISNLPTSTIRFVIKTKLENSSG